MSYTYHKEKKPDSSQSNDATVIRRTLVEHGLRPTNDDNQLASSSTSTAAAIETITKQHEVDQRDLQELNSKFSAYLDRVQYLENHNHRLQDDINNLKEHWGGDATEVILKFGPQLQKFRDDIDNALRDKNLQEFQLRRQEYELWQIQEQLAAQDPDSDVNHLNRLKQDLDASSIEMENLRSQLNQNATQLSRQQSLMDNLLKDINDLKNELDTQQLERTLIENELQTLKEHAAFQDAIYQIQRKEILSLSNYLNY